MTRSLWSLATIELTYALYMGMTLSQSLGLGTRAFTSTIPLLSTAGRGIRMPAVAPPAAVNAASDMTRRYCAAQQAVKPPQRRRRRGEGGRRRALGCSHLALAGIPPTGLRVFKQGDALSHGLPVQSSARSTCSCPPSNSAKMRSRASCGISRDITNWIWAAPKFRR